MDRAPVAPQPQLPELRRLLGLVRGHRHLLGGAVAAGIGSLACGLALPVAIAHLVDDAIRAHGRDLVWPLALVVAGLAVVRAVMNFLRRSLSGKASVRVEAELRGRLFAHLQRLSVLFHARWQSGQLLARATSDLDVIRMFVGFALVFFGFLVMNAVGVVVALALKSLPMAGLMIVLLIPLVVIAVRFNNRVEDVTARSREAVGNVATTVTETASGVRIIKAFGTERPALERMLHTAATLRDTNIEAIGYRAAYVPLLATIPNLMLASVVGIGALAAIDHHLSVGSLVAVSGYVFLLVVPMRYLGWMLSQSQQALAAARRVFEILDTEPDVADLPGAVAIDRHRDRIRGEVRFENVTFTYPGSSIPALWGVSFSVAGGETVALVGATGAGKSTVAMLLPRFADPDQGGVLVDGIDVRRVTLASLRRQFGIVFDEPVLFSATIAENIAFGHPDATLAQVEAAAAAAGASGFIAELPNGYATRVGENGYTLSGGQRQRLALARALVGDPSVVLLDDPLSSVDVRTEAEIETNLRALLGQRTMILIAHRASTVAIADRVILLEEGRVTATGHHAELLATNPAYRRVLAADLEIEELTG